VNPSSAEGNRHERRLHVSHGLLAVVLRASESALMQYHECRWQLEQDSKFLFIAVRCVDSPFGYPQGQCATGGWRGLRGHGHGLGQAGRPDRPGLRNVTNEIPPQRERIDDVPVLVASKKHNDVRGEQGHRDHLTQRFESARYPIFQTVSTFIRANANPPLKPPVP